jgi:phenylpyruvate tautomerase PptA (4-oxalocrotonate tautomerase family)
MTDNADSPVGSDDSAARDLAARNWAAATFSKLPHPSKEMIMPLWNICTPVGAYSAEQKKAFARDITALYTKLADLPAFYVVVTFRELAEEDYLVGGEPVNNFIRIFIDHVARQLETAEIRKLCRDEIEKLLAPHVSDRGFDWEFNIDETPLDLWQTQGLLPPPAFSEAEKIWARENRAVPYETV